MDSNNKPEAALDPRILLEIISTQTEIAKQGLDLGSIMTLVTQRAQALTGAAGAVIELAEDDDMVYRAVSGLTASMLGLRLERHASLSGLCVREGRMLACVDSEIDDRVDREACRRVGLRSMVVMPLHHQATTVGALKVMWREPGGFSETDTRVLGLMSELIGAAMFNATQHESGALYHRATHDALTDIGNRALFFDRLRQSLAHARRHGEQIGVLYLDMDGLKPINDNHGHRAGDAALQEMAVRLGNACRQTDTVARVGGDEFGVILSPVEGRAAAEQLRDRVVVELDRPLQFGPHTLAVAASIGLAVCPDDATEVDALLALADESMYADKRRRKARA